jgi:hypothetical protein
MNDHPCSICKATPAPYGYRRAGPFSALPAGKRGYLWACADHKADAEARWRSANGNPATQSNEVSK